MISKLKNKLTIDITLWIITSTLITLIGEFLYRGKFESVINFIKTYPYMFILNLSIVLLITSIAFLFKKRRFTLTVTSFVLLLGYISNAVVSKFRGTPITWADFSSIKDAITISKNYLTPGNIVLMVIVLAISMVGFYFIWKMDKSSDNYKKVFISSLIIIPITIATMIGMTNYVKAQYPDHIVNWDSKINCENNGFLYSLISSKPQEKVAPEGYSNELVNNVLNNITLETSSSMNTIEPNIMFVQMESFLDVSRLKDVSYEVNPLENYEKLHGENPHGLLGVPTFGGGTVRSEFEILTGLNIDYLPAGEIPNNSLLKTNVLETVAHILKTRGYNSTVTHDYIGNFYDRDIVYSNLGFDTFVPYEYMKDVQYNGYYPSDMTNLQVISDILDQEEKQFIYSIGVEGHGPYDTKDRENSYGISGDNLSKEDVNQLNNYFDVISGEDKYVAELIKLVEAKNEPTIIVFYSDHLPMLNVIDNKDVFDVEFKSMSDYFVWNNFGLELESKDLEAYHISSYILDALNINSGIMPSFHRNGENNENYQAELELLQYDILYGKKYSYNDAEYIDRADMELGIYEIKIDSVEKNNGELTVKGTNFTEKSKIVIDGTVVETEFVDSNTLKTKFDKNYKEISVAQIGRHDKRLGETGKYINK